MPTSANDIIKELSPARRKKVAARAAQLIAEEMTRRDLRHARKLTRVRVAKELGIGQDGVSKLEKRADLMISTLRKTVEAMGGACLWWLNPPIAILSSSPAFPKTSRTRGRPARSAFTSTHSAENCIRP